MDTQPNQPTPYYHKKLNEFAVIKKYNSPNRMAKYTCSYCSHEFAQLRKASDHEDICRLLADPSQYQLQEEDPIITKIENNTTSVYTILKHLAVRQHRLEKELIELKKQAIVKIDTLEWLNQSAAPPPANSLPHFIKTITTLELNDVDDILMNHSTPIDWIESHFTTALANYKKQIPTYTHRPIFIIVANVTATNPIAKMFYYTTPTDTAPISLWKETTEIHETIWHIMCKNIVKTMGEWRDANKNRTAADEKIYQSTLIKFIDPKKESTYCKKIKGILIEQLKYPTITYHLI